MRHLLTLSLGLLAALLTAPAPASPSSQPSTSPTTSPAPLLGSRENPVRCDGPRGEQAYLRRLRAPDGSAPTFTRIGSFEPGPDGHILDGYELTPPSPDLPIVFMDMYHPNYEEPLPIPGFTILPPR